MLSDLPCLHFWQADHNVKVTSEVVNQYIRTAVQARLAFDVPSSWRLFMVGMLPHLTLHRQASAHDTMSALANLCNVLVPDRGVAAEPIFIFAHTDHCIIIWGAFACVPIIYDCS